MDESDNNELLKSPLHQLELQTSKARNSKSPPTSPTPNSKATLSISHDILESKDKSYIDPSPMNNFDRDSIYSFDSVSTNGRLLDRLGLENEDLFDSEELSASRLDRLSISDISGRNGSISRSSSIQNTFPNLQNPFRLNSNSKPISTSNNVVNLDRFPSYKANSIFNIKPNLSLNGQGNSKDNQAFSVKNVPSKIVHPSRNRSIDSFHASILADSASIISRNSSSIISPQIDSHSAQFDDEYDEFNFNSSAESIETKQIHIPKSPVRNGADLSRTSSLQSDSSIQLTRNRSVSAATATVANMSPRSPLNKRSISDYTQSSSPNGKLADIDAESRLKLSAQLRSVGKHREASYQLQIAANSPYCNTRAMYLYAMALRFGQGVRQNDLNCLKWLCRCVLVHNAGDSRESINRIVELQTEDLLKLITNHINNDNSEIDPTKLCDYYSKLPSNQITKLVNSIKAQVDVIPLAYQEIGNFWINGWANIDKNEQLGIKCLSISSYMGNFNAMVNLGELWSTKTKTRRKDYYKSSAWYRLSEIFGITSIGNSWIYKDKYLEKK